MLKIKSFALLVVVALALAACNSETSPYKGKWKSDQIDGATMKLSFKEDGDKLVMTMTSEMNGQSETRSMPVIIKEDGIYMPNPMGSSMTPIQVLWLQEDGSIEAMIGSFSR